MAATIRDYKQTVVTTPATTIVCNMPTHSSGDLLLAFVAKDSTTGTMSASGSWASQGSTSLSGGLRGEVFALRATGSSETLTVTYSSNESLAWVVALKDINGSTIADGLSGTASWDASAASTTFPMKAAHSITPGVDDCLLFSFYVIGINGHGPTSYPNWVTLDTARALNVSSDGTGIHGCLSYTHQVTAAAITHPGYVAQNVHHDRMFLIAVRGTGSEKAAYLERGTTAATHIATLSGNSSAENGAWQSAVNVYTGAIGAWGVTGFAQSQTSRAGPADVNRAAVVTTVTPSTTNLSTIQLNFTTSKDCSGLMFFTSRFNAPAGYASNGTMAQGGVFMRLLDVDDDAKTWVVAGLDAKTSEPFDFIRCLVQTDQSTDTTFDTDLTLVSTAVTRLQLGVSTYNLLNGNFLMNWSEFWKLGTTIIAGGSSATPIDFEDFTRVVRGGTGMLPVTQIAGNAATFYSKLKVGGTDPVHVSINRRVFQFPTSVVTDTTYPNVHVDSGTLGIELAGLSTDTLDFGQCIFTSSTPYYFTLTSGFAPSSFDLTGATIINANVTLRTGVTIGNTSFINCPVFTQNSATLNGTTFQGTTVSANAPGSIDNCSFTSAGTGHAIEISATGTVTMEGNTFTGYGSTGTTDAAIYNNSGGSVTINLGQGDTAPTYRNGAGASTTINAYVDTFTLNSSESSSLIQIFTTGTQTVLASGTGTQVTFNHSGNTVDYVVQKAGFLPQRVTGYVLSGSPTITVTLSVDPVYASGHGLILNTDYAYNATTRVLTIVAAEQGRELYSALIEDFISESGYFNKPFPMQAIGIDRIDFTSDGTTAATLDSGDIQFWRGAGMEWEHATTGNKTHKFCSIVGTGTNAANTKGYYQHTDGSAPVALTLVSNNVNQVIQYYSDPNGDGSTADGYSRTGHLVVKLFNDGYYQASINVLTAYGISAIESFEYVIPLQMTSTGLGTGDRSITITVTDTTPAGTEYQTGYTFDYKIEGGASDSPSDLLRQWIYDVFTDPTASDYASKINFNWPDPIVESGGSYSTQYGYVYGQDTTTTFHGFYVEEGSVYHPDFLRQQSNDGTYFTTPVLANVSITGMPTASGANTRLQISNSTGAAASAWTANTAYATGSIVKRTTGIGTENTAGLFFRATTGGTSHATTEPTWVITNKGVFGTAGSTTTDGTVTWECFAVLAYDGDPVTSAYSTTYTNGDEFLAGETYRIRFTELDAATSFKDFSTTAVAASTGFTVAVSTTSDSVYASNAVNGSTVTTFSADYTNNRVDVSADADFTAAQFYAFFQNTLTTTSGMYNFWGGVTAVDAGTYRINDTVVDIYFDNTIGAFVKQTGTQRIFRVSGEYPVQDPTTSTHGVQINWANQVYLEETGVSGLTGAESAQLLALGTAAQVADAVWDEDVTTHTTASTTGKTLSDAKAKAALAAALSA